MVDPRGASKTRWRGPVAQAALELLVASAIVAAPVVALAALYDVGPRMPRLLEALLWACFGWVTLGRALRGARGEPAVRRVGATLCALLGAHLLWSVRIPAWLADETSAELASRASADLSTTWNGLPWLGLIHAWGTCAFAWLARDLVVEAWPQIAPAGWQHIGRGVGLVALVMTLGLGASAVLGYATGSPWLWPG